MHVLTVSDEVVPVVYSLNASERFAHIDAVLSCGDLPDYYLDFLITTLRVPCFYVLGNHDVVSQSSDGTAAYTLPGCISVEERSDYWQGLLIAGLGGSIRYNSEPGPQYTELQMTRRFWALVPRLLVNRLRYGRYLDVMLTHAPPLYIHNGDNFPHRGFKVFLLLMDYFAPRYLIHGHMHRSYNIRQATETRYRNTLVINTAGYRVLSIPPQGAASS